MSVHTDSRPGYVSVHDGSRPGYVSVHNNSRPGYVSVHNGSRPGYAFTYIPGIITLIPHMPYPYYFETINTDINIQIILQDTL